MILIREIVQHTLATGYLTQTAEEQLRYLLQCTHYEQEDIQAFHRLQRATWSGVVQQESRQSNRATG